MWTPATRRQHSRIVTRYQTDLTDAEWARDRAALAEAQRDRQAGRVTDARDRQRHLLCYAGGAPAAERLAALGRFTWFAAWRDDGRLERIPLIELAECGNLSKLLNERSRLLVPYLTTTMTTTFLASLRMSWTDF